MPVTREIVEKPWGRYEVIHQQSDRAVKILFIEPGQMLSLQSYSHRSEHWFVLEGTAEIVIDDQRRRLKPNEAVDIPVGTKHRIYNPGKATISILEVQHGERVDEADIVRYRDRYGRPATGQPYVAVKLTPPISICEVGCNHRGDIDIAVEMIKVAVQFCKVDVVKFQKRCNRELLTPEEYSAPLLWGYLRKAP